MSLICFEKYVRKTTTKRIQIEKDFPIPRPRVIKLVARASRGGLGVERLLHKLHDSTRVVQIPLEAKKFICYQMDLQYFNI